MIAVKPIPADLITRAEFDSRTIVAPSGCIEWPRVNQQGYGRVRSERHGEYQAHRVALALSGVDIPQGLVVDHLCRNRRCVNVEHLEVTTPLLNTARGVSPIAACISARMAGRCINGHDLGKVGLHKSRDGKTCAQCGRDRVAAYKARKRSEAA